jgi:O-antigen ligase
MGVVGCFLLWTVIVYVAPDVAADYTSRLGATDSDDSENYGRLLTAGMALNEISQKPIAGWGVERFGEAGMLYLPEDHDFMPAHISFLQYWYAEGVVGAIGFLMLFALPVRRLVKALKSSPSDNLASAKKLGLSVVLLLFITSNLHPILFNRFFYMPLFVFAGLAASFPTATREPREAPQAKPL